MEFYIVQRGDTLSSIAKKTLGRAERWVDIARLNKQQNPSKIFVGETLRLPDRTQDANSINTQNVTYIRKNNQFPASVALARGYMFVIFEQLPNIGATKIIRKVAAIPKNYSLNAANLKGTLSPAEHVLNIAPRESQFLSASSKPFAAPSINGQPLILDVAKIKQAGGQIYTLESVVQDLKRFVGENPSTRNQVDKLIYAITRIEGEVLINGGTPPDAAKMPSAVHNAYIKSAEYYWREYTSGRISKQNLVDELANLENAYSKARIVGSVGRVLFVIGVVLTVVDLTKATNRSITQHSFKPIGAEVVRQTGGWGGALAGARIGFATGAMFGIETGPGAIVSGAVGAIIFGAIGYFSADWAADHISPN